MMSEEKGEPSAAIVARVAAAQARQYRRQECLNVRLDGDRLRELASPDAAGQKLLDAIIEDGRMTARGFNRVLRVARSLADLQARDLPAAEDIATALSWRGVSLS